MFAITEASLPCWSARSNASGCNADQTRSKATQFTMIVVALQPVDACCQIVSKLLLSQSLPNDTTSGFAVAMCTSVPAAAAGTSGCCKSKGHQRAKGFRFISLLELARSSGRQVIHSFQFFTVEICRECFLWTAKHAERRQEADLRPVPTTLAEPLARLRSGQVHDATCSGGRAQEF